MRLRFTIRDLLWLTLVVALAASRQVSTASLAGVPVIDSQTQFKTQVQAYGESAQIDETLLSATLGPAHEEFMRRSSGSSPSKREAWTSTASRS